VLPVAGLKCDSGAVVDPAMPYCPVVSRTNPPPQKKKGRTRTVVRKVRSEWPGLDSFL
jgi:hypothetical protein